MVKVMKVRLRKMSSREFEAFREYSTNDYVKDLMKSQNISSEVNKVLFTSGNTILRE